MIEYKTVVAYFGYASGARSSSGKRTWIWGSERVPRSQLGEIGRGSGALERVQQTQAKGGLIRPDVSYPVLS